MLNIKKILVPTDFSNGAEKAYPVAQKIAKRFGALIDLIHVIPTAKYLNESFKKLTTPLDVDKELYPKIIREAEQLSHKAMEIYFSEGQKGQYFVKIDRKISDTVIKHATTNSYDMIVMGAKGKHGTKLLRGGTTEKIIRNSKIPVFTVDDRLNENKLENILMPTDCSTVSFAAFPMAVELADIYNSGITLYHVMELYGSLSEDMPRKQNKSEFVSIYESLIERLNQYLANREIDKIHIQRTGVTFEDQAIITDGNQSRTIPLYTKIEKGISAHYVIEEYAEHHADLVVMATHGRSGFAHLILGSTAEKVAQYVSKPVITIRPKKDALK